MSNNTNITVVAAFPDHGKAEAALDELIHGGFKKEQLGVAAPGSPLHPVHTPTDGMEERAARGAVVGGIAGTIVGGVAGAVAVATIPGLGMVVAGGLLAALIGGGAAGAAVGVFTGPFVALGLSERDARRYEEGLLAGQTIVVVRTEQQHEKALTILRRHGPNQLDIFPATDSSPLARQNQYAM